MNKYEKPWIEKGYITFAYDGPTGLRVEKMAREIEKNKSSFYHHFADLEVFTEALLDQHRKQALIVSDKESKCVNQQELIQVLVEHKTDMLFNRQLRIHRENSSFRTCFEEINKFTIPAIMGVWSKIIGLEDNSYLADLVLRLSLENFFLQITDETLNEQWLNSYFENIHTLIKAFKNQAQIQRVDGTV